LVEPRKWELRKRNMTWRILFPGCEIPKSPCGYHSPALDQQLANFQVYDDDLLISLTNTDLLLKSFKETVESGIESGDIEGIEDETLDRLL
jgi:hypothetical protein